MSKKRTGKKIIAGLLVTTIMAGTGVAAGMAIQNAYGTPTEDNTQTEAPAVDYEKLELQEKLAEAKIQLANTQSELDTVNIQLTKTVIDLEMAQQNVTCLTNEMQLLETQLASERSDKESLQLRYNSIIEELTIAESHVAELNNQLTKCEQEKETLQTRITELEEQLQRDENKLYLDYYLHSIENISGAEIFRLTDEVLGITSSEGIYKIEDDFSLTPLTQEFKDADIIESTENYTVLAETSTGKMTIYEKTTGIVTDLSTGLIATAIFDACFDDILIRDWKASGANLYHMDLSSGQIIGVISYETVPESFTLDEVLDLGNGYRLIDVRSTYYIWDSDLQITELSKLDYNDSTSIAYKNPYYICGIDKINHLIHFMTQTSTDTEVPLIYTYNYLTKEESTGETIRFTVKCYNNEEILIDSSGLVECQVGQTVESLLYAHYTLKSHVGDYYKIEALTIDGETIELTSGSLIENIKELKIYQ